MNPLTKTLHNNISYYFPFLIFLVMATLMVFLTEKGDTLLWLNDRHTVLGDIFFRNATKLGEEAGFIGVMLILLFVKVRYAYFVPILGFLTILVTFSLKEIFGHNRPSIHFRDLGVYEALHKVDLVPVLQGTYSFPSGHTMGAFAIFTYLALSIKSKILKLVLLLIAIAAGFSRIYLIQHFLQDVVFGALIGVVLGTGVFLLQERVMGEKGGNSNYSIQRILKNRRMQRNKV